MITASNLGKRYRLGESGKFYGTLTNSFASSFRRLVDHSASSERYIWALDAVDFTIHEGDIVGVIGRNGAGKSTLLKILTRITEPTTGRACLHGRVGSLLEVGTGFHQELTGRDNVFLNGSILGMSRREITNSFRQIVDFAGVERFIDTPVKRYSSGMYMRLAFSVAAHLRTEILLVDEVLSVGDAAFQRKCLGKIGEVANEGRTVVFVSHNMDAVRRVCSRGMYFAAGKLLCDATTDEAIRAYFADGENAAGSRNFHPDAAATVGITSLCLRSDTGDLTRSFVVSDAIQVELQVNVATDVPSGTIGVRVSTIEGTPVFTTHHIDAMSPDSPAAMCLASGEHHASFRIPGNFLRPGTYSVSAGVVDSNAAPLDLQEDALTFDVEGSTGVRGESRAGVVTVTLPWTIERSDAGTN